MVNKNFLMGILVMVLVFGMTVVGCDDGTSGNTDPKNLVITGITGTHMTQGVHGYTIGIFPVGTSDENVLADFTAAFTDGTINYAVAGYDDEDTNAVQNGSTYTLTVPLINLRTESPWTGSGRYDIYFILYDGDTAYVYKAANISITDATTTIAISKFEYSFEQYYGDWDD